jgi:drug/metabolite transporter (DMT)-like permease
LTAVVLLTSSVVTVRVIGHDLPTLETVFLRNLLGLFISLPFAYLPGRSGLRTRNHGLLLTRGCLAFIALSLGYAAIPYLPLNDATALTFTRPLFATVASALFLRESLRNARSLTTILAFVGMLIVLRPGVRSLDWPVLAMLGSAVLAGTNSTVVKHLSRTDSAGSIVTYMTLYALPLSAAAAWFVWTPPPPSLWMPLILLALTSTFGNMAVTRAFREWEASTVVAFDFGRLPLTAAAAWLLFSERPDPYAWIGSAVIVASLFWSAKMEMRSRAPAVETASPV